MLGESHSCPQACDSRNLRAGFPYRVDPLLLDLPGLEHLADLEAGEGLRLPPPQPPFEAALELQHRVVHVLDARHERRRAVRRRQREERLLVRAVPGKTCLPREGQHLGEFLKMNQE